MKRLLAGVTCQIVGIAVMVLGFWPALRVYEKSLPDARVTIRDAAYGDYEAVRSKIILLAGIAIGIFLLWLGNRIKSSRNKRI